MSLDELYVEWADASYQQVQEAFDRGEITHSEKVVLEKQTDDYKAFEKDITQGDVQWIEL